MMGNGRTMHERLTLAGTFQEAFKELGGMPALVQWGQENPTEFFKIWAKVSAWDEDRLKKIAEEHPQLQNVLTAEQYKVMAERSARLALAVAKSSQEIRDMALRNPLKKRVRKQSESSPD
jgi:hypothetical protein